MDRIRYEGLSTLVTGAGGFVGQHLCRRLLSEGARVTALVRPEGRYPALESTDAEVARVDVADRDGLLELFRAVGPRVVFHLAACLDRERGVAALDRLVHTNVVGTINLLRAAAAAGSQVVVHTGTSEEYGRNPPPFTESQQPDPMTPYAASKATATMWCRTLHRSLGLPCISARLFMIYGPGQPEHFFIAQLLESLRSGKVLDMTPGEQTRDFTWVDDAVEALVRLGRSPQLGGGTFNVCTGHETSLRDVVRLVGELTASEVPVRLGARAYRESELFRVWGSPYALHGAIGYKPKTTIREGLCRLLEAEGLKTRESASDPAGPGASGERR